MVGRTPHESSDPAAPWLAYAGIFVCTAGVLMSEVLLTRIFSFTIWYHLAYLTISTALLSFGAAGSFLVAYPRALKNPQRLAGFSAVAAGLTLILGLAYLGRNPIDPIIMFSEPARFSIGLLQYYAVICIPFLLSGIAIAAPLAAYPSAVNRLYAADLAGAAVGCTLAVAALKWTESNATPVFAAVLLIEIGFVQKYVLPLGYPTYLLSATIVSLLVSARRLLCGMRSTSAGQWPLFPA